MGKLIEKIKDVFTGKFVYKPKRKEAPQPGVAQHQAEKQEEEPKEQK